MEYKYTLDEQDFLDFQLFTASQSLRITKKRKQQWFLLTALPILLAVYFFMQNNITLTNYFGSIALLFGVFYPRYFKWRYKKHYQSYNKENYSKSFGKSIVLEIHLDYIFSKDQTGEGKINHSEIERIDEIQRLILIKISNGNSLVIPKEQINISSLKHDLKRLNFTINRYLDWKW